MILPDFDRTNFEAGRTGPDGKNPSGSNSVMNFEKVLDKVTPFTSLDSLMSTSK
jgi:hypothetical protein